MAKKADLRKRNNQSSRAMSSGGGAKPTAVSAAAMGRGLVVLLATATSCAAFSSSGSGAGPLTSTSTSTIVLSSSVANRQSQCRRPMSLSSSTSPNDMYDEHQAAMDEYLDYVGRRYNRLRSPPSKTSAVATILGLTRLASARLRFRQSVLQMPYSALSSSSSSGIANSLSTTIQSSTPTTISASLFPTMPKKLIKLNTLNRVVANFFSLRIIPELIHKTGFSVAGLLAFLLIAGPLLLTGTQA